jgi:acetaldehyde dehydrogenase
MGMLVGLDNDSPRLAMAAELGIPVSKQGIQAIVDNPDSCEIVFDATTAKAHLVHGPILEKLGKRTIDLTPAAIGLQVVPVINLEEGLKTSNVNLISCGGQAVLGLVWAINKVSPVTYAEVINASASRGVGMGTGKHRRVHRGPTECLMTVAGAKSGKAIIVINQPNRPLSCITPCSQWWRRWMSATPGNRSSLLDVIKQIQGYVPATA